jgi:hypothetical protein
MAKLGDVQRAQCIKVIERQSKGGDVFTIATFDLEGQRFELFAGNGFEPKKDSWYFPVCKVVPTGYTGNNGKIYGRNAVIVEWVVEVK